ncbi:MAG: trypsin-like peptidase domain-containing protein [Pontiellaceae bacterium]|nr:trypsin-like peptidase domain-containing protein [Pontiellaceae bacterium]
MKPHNILRSALCLSIFLSPAFSPVRADEKDEKIAAQQKAEEAERAAEKAKQQEEYKAEIPYSFNDVSDKIVIIECKAFDGGSFSGSGFVAKMGGKTYLFTNQHVILGAASISFKTISGEALRPKGVELSMSRDIARLPLADGEGFEISEQPDLHEPIAVFGNSEGGGVATELYGKVTDVNPETIVVSAEFVSGNSGSPVLNDKQQVVGVASYVHFSEDEEGEETTKRYCFRLDGSEWAAVNWKQYNEDYGREYRETEALIDSIFEIIIAWGDDPYGYVPSDYKDYDLQKWAKDHNGMVKKITRLSEQGSGTQKEVDKTNKQISRNINESAMTLSAFCVRKSKHVSMKLESKDLTGFLRNEYENYVGALKRASGTIEEYGKALSERDYFYLIDAE